MVRGAAEVDARSRPASSPATGSSQSSSRARCSSPSTRSTSRTSRASCRSRGRASSAEGAGVRLLSRPRAARHAPGGLAVAALRRRGSASKPSRSTTRSPTAIPGGAAIIGNSRLSLEGLAEAFRSYLGPEIKVHVITRPRPRGGAGGGRRGRRRRRRHPRASIDRGCQTYVTGNAATNCRLDWSSRRRCGAFRELADEAEVALVDAMHYGMEKPPQLAMVSWFGGAGCRPSSSLTGRSRAGLGRPRAGRRAGAMLAALHGSSARPAPASRTTAVERDPRLLAEQRQRFLVRPGIAVDPARDQCVVDVADREDPGVEVELVGGRGRGVPAAVEPLVVVENQPAHGSGEAAEIRRRAARPTRGGGGSPRTPRRSAPPASSAARSGTESLPMSCSRPPIASARRRPGDSPSSSPTWTARRATRRVCSSVYSSLSASWRVSARTCAPRKVSSAATSSAACRSPASGRDWAVRNRSIATGTPTNDEPDELEPVAEPPAEIRRSASISAAGSAAPSQAMPIATTRSPIRRVSAKVRSARSPTSR